MHISYCLSSIGYAHWLCALVMRIGYAHWLCTLVIRIGYTHWLYALVIRIGYAHRLRAWGHLSLHYTMILQGMGTLIASLHNDAAGRWILPNAEFCTRSVQIGLVLSTETAHNNRTFLVGNKLHGLCPPFVPY